MKTLFITIYDGAISKNVLRTDIFALLRKEYRIILFVPASKREYYDATFGGEAVKVESVPPPKHPIFEAKFQALALDLFHTESVRIKIAYRYAIDGKKSRYLLKMILWHLGRFSFVHRILRRIYQTVPDRSFDRYFVQYTPSIVFVPNMMSNDDYRMLKSARRFGVKSIGMPKSWDNLTTKTFFNVFPDRIIVQNRVMREAAIRLFGFDASRISVAGHPAFDVYASSEVGMSREEFCADLGLDASRKIILYAAAGDALAPRDEEVLDELINAIETTPGLQGAQLLVRPHPKYVFDPSRIRTRPFVRIDHPGIKLTKKNASWEFEAADILHLRDSLRHMDVLISTASTLNLEGAIFDRPLISIGFDGRRQLSPELSTYRYYRYEHLQPLVESSGMPVAKSFAELKVMVEDALRDPSLLRAGRRRIVRDLVGDVDGGAGSRVASEIIAYEHEQRS